LLLLRRRSLWRLLKGGSAQRSREATAACGENGQYSHTQAMKPGTNHLLAIPFHVARNTPDVPGPQWVSKHQMRGWFRSAMLKHHSVADDHCTHNGRFVCGAEPPEKKISQKKAPWAGKRRHSGSLRTGGCMEVRNCAVRRPEIENGYSNEFGKRCAWK
jgi:hypothetical protein